MNRFSKNLIQPVLSIISGSINPTSCGSDQPSVITPDHDKISTPSKILKESTDPKESSGNNIVDSKSDDTTKDYLISMPPTRNISQVKGGQVKSSNKFRRSNAKPTKLKNPNNSTFKVTEKRPRGGKRHNRKDAFRTPKQRVALNVIQIGDLNQPKFEKHYECQQVTSTMSLQDKNVWILDSGATNGMCYDASQFTHLSPLSVPLPVTLADKSSIQATHFGTVRFVKDNTLFAIRNILYVPQLKRNLLSTSQLSDLGYIFDWKRKRVLMLKEQDDLSAPPQLIFKRVGGLMLLCFNYFKTIQGF